MTFGGQVGEKDAARMLDMYMAEGHTWVDTAFIYTEGRSETIVGRLLKGSLRERVFLATKAYPDKLGPGKPRGMTPGSVRGQLETSLRRMKQEYVDLFYLHAPDNRTPLEATLEACATLRAEGKLREIGMSNYASWQVAEAVMLCLKNDWPAPIIYQGMYNAVTRDVERECIPACRHFGMDFIAYNPLAAGLLTGKYADLVESPASGRFSGAYYRERFWKQEYFEAVRVIGEAAERARIPMGEAALRWLLHHSKGDGLLLGASKVEHLKANLEACRRGPLGTALLNAFDEAWEIARPACEPYFRDGDTKPPPAAGATPAK